MPWAPAIASTDIRSGPFQIGVGAAASEVGVGECDELEITAGYDVVEIKGGAFYGRESLIDAVVQGIKVSATFNAFQLDTPTFDKLFALGTLSAGATSKSETLENLLIVGKSLLASAVRIRFHKESVADLTDETKDIIFPKAIIVPRPDPWPGMSGKETITVPCLVLAFYDTSTLAAVVFGKNVA